VIYFLTINLSSTNKEDANLGGGGGRKKEGEAFTFLCPRSKEKKNHKG